MNQYLIDLKSAFDCVETRYYFAEVYRNLDNFHVDQEAVEQTTENSLSAEIFSNWRSIMKLNPDTYDKLALDFDVRKDWFDEVILNKAIRSYRPDIVLHWSQLKWDPPYQKVYVEVKANRDPFIKGDILKIINAQVRLQFESCVFITVNSNLTEIKTLIRNIRNSETTRLRRHGITIDWSRIFLLHSAIEDATKRSTDLIPFDTL